MLENLKAKNSIPFFNVFDEEFKKYGTVLNNIDTKEIVVVGEKIALPESGTVYHAFEPVFKTLTVANEIKQKCFGETACQIGYCYGYNSYLNALEWHNCNEINIAVTDAVLILAKREDFDKNFQMDSKDCKAFFVPKGTAIEVYSDSLHFCPCQVSNNGFGMVVGLTLGTNTPLDKKHSDRKLWAKNKWLVSHKANKDLIDRGAFVGINGDNIQIKY